LQNVIDQNPDPSKAVNIHSRWATGGTAGWPSFCSSTAGANVIHPENENIIDVSGVPRKLQRVLKRYCVSQGLAIENNQMSRAAFDGMSVGGLRSLQGIGRKTAKKVLNEVSRLLVSHENVSKPKALQHVNFNCRDVQSCQTNRSISCASLDDKTHAIVCEVLELSGSPELISSEKLESLSVENLLRAKSVGLTRATKIKKNIDRLLFGQLSSFPETAVDYQWPGEIAQVIVKIDEFPDKSWLSSDLVKENLSIRVDQLLGINDEFLNANNITSEYAEEIIFQRDKLLNVSLVDSLLSAGGDLESCVVASLSAIAVHAKWSPLSWQGRTGVGRNKVVGCLQSIISSPPGKPKEKIFSYLSNLNCANRLLDGETLSGIASDLGCTRERVRQRAKAVGVTSKDKKKVRERIENAYSQKVKNCETFVRDFIYSHPGCYESEVIRAACETFGYTPDIIKKNISQFAWLLLPESETDFKIAPLKSLQETRQRGIKAIQAAATMAFPLSKNAYDDLIEQKFIVGPSSIRLLQVFGTWRAACNKANVESGPRGTQPGHLRKWSDQEVFGYVCDFLLDRRFRGTSSHYQEWVGCQEKLGYDVPSFGTLRNTTINASWKQISTRALSMLRVSWEEGSRDTNTTS
jgi:hypothetical protein